MAEPVLNSSTLARNGTTELHAEPSAFGLTAPAWVALSMLVVVGIMLWQKVPALIGRILDARIAGIRQQLDEAKALRAEAEVLLADAHRRDAASAQDAQAIVAQAEQESAAMLTKAQSDSAELLRRRTQMAEDKIAAAERGAVAEVRARAADAATEAARAIIAQQHGESADRVLVDRTIAGLGGLN